MIDKDLFYIKSEYVLFKFRSTAHESLQNKTDNLEWNQLTQFTELTQLRLDFVLSSAEQTMITKGCAIPEEIIIPIL